MNIRLCVMLVMMFFPASSVVPDVRAGQAGDIEKYCAMLHSLDDGERATARAELVKIGKPAVPQVLAVLSGDPVYLGREGAAFVLGRSGDARAVRPLIAALADDYDAVRQEASQALARIGGPGTVETLLEAVGKGGSDPFLAAGAATLGLLGDKRALPALEKLMKHGNPDVAAAAAEALRRIRSGAAKWP